MFQEDSSKTGLNQHPLLAVGVVVVLFWSVTVWESFVSGGMLIFLKLISFGALGFVVIPFFLGLPHGRIPFRQYAQDIYLRITSYPGRQVLAGIVFGGVLAGSVWLTNLLVNGLPASHFLLTWQEIDLFQVADAVLHGFWEEVFFRGIVLALLLRKRRTPIGAMTLAALVFALLHLNIFHLLRLFCMAMLWIVLTMQAKSLLPAVLSHIVYDAFIGIFPPQVPPGEVFSWLFLWQALVALVCLAGILLARRIFPK